MLASTALGGLQRVLVDDDAELAAYNAMLAELARRDTSGQRRR